MTLFRALLILLLAVQSTYSQPPTASSIYGPVSREDYLLGRFRVDQHPAFIKLSSTAIPTRGREQFLRKEAAEALGRLLGDLKRDHPQAEFWVVSSTRNYYDQKGIWESKWNGGTLVEGKALNKSIQDPAKRAQKILEFSSMPGTSRHHWGTDFDMNVLTNVYYDSGNGKIVYDWFKKNASKYGFCQPYTAGRKKGYFEERWHWSYLPISRLLLADWKTLFDHHTEKLKGFEGFAASGHLAPTYVESINTDCQ